jgi:hypothetical protein
MPSSSASASNSSRAAALLAALVVACGGGTSRDAAAPDGVERLDLGETLASSDAAGEVLPARPCSLVLPSCPAPPPGYSATIAPLLARRCRPACHEPGGVEAAQPLTTQPEVYARRAKVVDQVFHCKMPPLDRAGLPDDEAITILQWLVCGSPNN